MRRCPARPTEQSPLSRLSRLAYWWPNRGVCCCEVRLALLAFTASHVLLHQDSLTPHRPSQIRDKRMMCNDEKKKVPSS